MSSCPEQQQHKVFSVNAIDKQPVRLNMTFAISCIISDQKMISVFVGQLLLLCKHINNSAQLPKLESSFFASFKSLLNTFDETILSILAKHLGHQLVKAVITLICLRVT